MSDFDRIFDAKYAAVDLFTNRLTESSSFERSLSYHRQRILDGTATLANIARHHVLTFYGVGGIGKTRLSQRLEHWAVDELPETDEWGPTPSFDRPIKTVRFDFHGSASVNAAELVLRLRAALADTRRRFPAFDLGVASWWAFAHPGVPLPDLRSSAGFDVRGQINDTINGILSEAGARFGAGPLTIRTGSLLIDAIRSRVIRNKALRECEPLTAIIEQTRFDPSPYVAASLAGLLSWDFERLPDDRKPLVVAFADAVEYVQGGDRSQERLLNRIVHLTPGFLWVVTSRRSLDWDSGKLATLLPATGPRVWPGIGLGVQTEPRQHLVGDLSDSDVDRFLAMASGAGGNPTLSAAVRDRIRRGAHGLPLYLDLSLSMARTVVGGLDPEAFGGPLPQLVTHVFADLPEAECEIARTASLMTRFDPDTLAQASGKQVGDALRFCQRSLVTYDGHPLFPYRLHDAVREAIADEPAEAPGAWARSDRRARAAALVEVLQSRHDDSLDSVEQRRDILEGVARLCEDNDLRVPWLLQAALDLPGIEQMAVRFPGPHEGTWIGQVSKFFDAWRGRTVRERIEYLTDFLTNPGPEDIRQKARLWLGYSYRTIGRDATSLPILQELLVEDPGSDLLRYQVARTLHKLGRYEELRAHMRDFPSSDPTADLRIMSDLAFDHAEFPEAFAGVEARAAYLRSIGKHRIAMENRAAALWRRALGGYASVDECSVLVDDADRSGMGLTFRSALVSKIICLPADDPHVPQISSELNTFIDTSRGQPGWREYTGSLIVALRRGNASKVDEIRDEWLAGAPSWSPNRQVVDRICVFAGYPAAFPPPQFGPGIENAEIDERWHTFIDALVHR